MAPNDVLRFFEAKRSVFTRNCALFTASFPVIQSLVRSDVRFRTDPFSELSEPVHRIRLKRLKQHRSTSYSIRTHFQMPDSHSDSKGVNISVYTGMLVLVYSNLITFIQIDLLLFIHLFTHIIWSFKSHTCKLTRGQKGDSLEYKPCRGGLILLTYKLKMLVKMPHF